MKQSEQVQVIEIPMIGPEPDGIRYCVKCRKDILPGEHWRMIERLGRGGLAVGVHDGCYAVQVPEQVTP
jgi:uncharacterized protein with PIN domain